MPMALILDRERAAELRHRGVLVDCSQCAHAIEKKSDKQIALCAVLRVMIGTGLPRLCSSFQERH